MAHSSPSFEAVALSIEDDVAVLTLNRPETLNALNEAMFVEIQSRLRRLQPRGRVRW